MAAMTGGEFLTKSSVWLALTAYVIGAGFSLESNGSASRRSAARWAWTIGCGLFPVHVDCAFAYFHHWSHGAAYWETARQTAALTGWSWGGGLYFNYLFALLWLTDVLWSWLAPVRYARRSSAITASWHGFFVFMLFNGAVVFVHGPLRWFGVLLCTMLAILWIRYRRRGSPVSKGP